MTRRFYLFAMVLVMPHVGDNTIVMYSTDNGAEVMSWPDGGTTPFRGEKNTEWEGGYRVPDSDPVAGVIKPGTIYNDVFSHEDMVPTLMAAAGDPDIKDELLKGYSAIGRDYKVHLDGYNLLPYFGARCRKRRAGSSCTGPMAAIWRRSATSMEAAFPGAAGRGPRCLAGAVRPTPSAETVHFARRSVRAGRQGGHGLCPLAVRARLPTGAAQAYVANWLQSFKEFPPRQKAASFSIDQVMENLATPHNR